jgi:hypothetical protein
MKRILLALPLCLMFGVHCDAADEIEAEIDCQDVCQRYADCFDDDYDVSACQDRCEDRIDTGDLTQAEVDSCDNCIDDRSCAGGTLNCATECLDIVP